MAVFAGILCVPVLGEVELPLPGTLLGQPNPALVGIEQLYVVILPPDAKPNKDGLVWKNLEAVVESRISQTGIKIAPVFQLAENLGTFSKIKSRLSADWFLLVSAKKSYLNIWFSKDILWLSEKCKYL